MADFPALMARQILRATGLFGDFDVSFDVSDVSLSPVPGVDLRIEQFEFTLLEVLRGVRVDVQRGGNIGVTKDILNHLDVDAFLAHPGCEGVPKCMATEWRKKNEVRFAGVQHMIIAVPDDSANGLIQRSLMLRMTKAVDEDEIRIAIHFDAAAHAGRHLIPSFFKEGFFDVSKHGDSADSGLGLRRVHVEVAARDSVLVIYQSVVDINHPVTEVYIAPAEANRFTHAQARSQHHRKDRIPMPVLRTLLQIVQK